MATSWRPARLDSYKAIVAKYMGRYGILAPHEAEELEKAYKDIAEIQRTCGHCYKTETTFTRVLRRCEYCDLIDPQ